MRSNTTSLYPDEFTPVLECSRSDELPRELLLPVAILASAVNDLNDILQLPPGNAATVNQIIKAASAARFFLTPFAEQLIRDIGLEADSVARCVTLAHTALDRMRLSAFAVLNGPDSTWCDAIDGVYRKELPPQLAAMAGRQEEFAWAA